MPSGAEDLLGDVDLAVGNSSGVDDRLGLVLRIALGAEGLPGHVERRRDNASGLRRAAG